MTAKMFAMQFAKEANKEKFIQKHIVKTYIPYGDKVEMCGRICRATLYDNGTFRMNSPAQMMMNELAVIEAYTDIEIDYEQVLPCYDVLAECGAIAAIIGMLPELEMSTWQRVLGMTASDIMTNERDLVSFIEHKAETFEKVLETLSELIPAQEE